MRLTINYEKQTQSQNVCRFLSYKANKTKQKKLLQTGKVN